MRLIFWIHLGILFVVHHFLLFFLQFPLHLLQLALLLFHLLGHMPVADDVLVLHHLELRLPHFLLHNRLDSLLLQLLLNFFNILDLAGVLLLLLDLLHLQGCFHQVHV